MKVSLKQEGFGAVGILLVVLLVGLLGIVGWKVWEAGQKSPSSQSNPAQQHANQNTKTSQQRKSFGEAFKTIQLDN